MKPAKLSEKRLREALKRAILGLRALDGMTGTVEKRRTHVRAAGYSVCDALGIRFPGYRPLEDAEKRLKER